MRMPAVSPPRPGCQASIPTLRLPDDAAPSIQGSGLAISTWFPSVKYKRQLSADSQPA
jgi:hypothetical protein